ncbi:hypothetical protein JYU34_009245 [Plutella xylostella]|uniref:Cadherin domain-containing protein n=1 Tax=Plutella xylostella TaxID=51655 RepID=A0ABQ7QJ10_PLUXY|nr:hypothetical protein JYU34_009245 [Plutella xylostella]
MLGAWLALAAVACAQAGPGPPGPITPPEPLHFEYPLYNLTVPENSPARTAAAAPPGAPAPALRRPPGTRLRFRIRHGDKDKLFKVEERCVGELCFAVLRTRAGHDVLNRERRDRYRLQLRATAAGPAGRRDADTELDLTVTDVNDLSPLFYPTEYEVTAREDLPAAASVARVAADDADLGRAGQIYYSLAEPSDQFAVHPTSGVVWLTRPLRHAERARHELGVLAQDRAALLARGAAAPAARARLTVHVARANLHAPELSVQHLPELPGAPAGLYAVLTATDRDEGEAGRVAAVDIVDGDPHGHFRVRALPQPGRWAVLLHALRDPLAAPPEYNLTIRARDAGRPPRAAYLALPARPAPRAAAAPVFSKQLYEVAVPETAPPHTPLVRLKVAERAGAGAGAGAARTSIEIVGGNEGGEFLVHAESGVLYTAVRLDAERRAAYTLTVAAVDQGAAAARDQSSAKVQVTVLDANDNDPVFDPPALEVTVRENEPAGALVARAAARDADSGEAAYLSYSLADLTPVPFTVEHFTGAVRTARRLDYESMRRVWRLRVRASDWGQPHRRQAELALTVRVLDVNDNRPQWERAACAGPLPRRTPPGSPLATLSALDPDAGDVVSYRLAGGNDDGCFALDAASGALSLACDLRDARADTRVLNVTATDGTHFADATTVTFHLTAGGGGALECRDTGAARRLAELLAAAARANQPPDPADEFPALPSRYGDNLHSPEFVDFPVEVKVNESVALGTTLVTLKARDRDLGYNGLLVFAISDGDYDSAFRVDPSSGALQLIGYLDREREAEYFLNVTVWDQGAPPRAASRLLPVTVLDVNDNKPVFARSLASLRVTENALNGTAVFHAHATDADAGIFSEITYSVSGADAGEFCIEPKEGTLLVCAPLDRERRELYELTITATDGGGLRSEAIVRVTVDDINDVVPHFALPGYNARIREDVPIGTVVAVVEAIDPDLGAGGVLTYSLPDQSSDDVVFTIDESSGTLRTAKFLDYEERQVYGILVRATDGGLPALWAEATLIVEVLDVDENQHDPQFADFVLEASVPENAPRGTSVITAAAKDADPPGRDSRLIYYVVGGSGMGYFSVDDAGVVRTLAPLDREAVPSYWLTICAEDHGLVPRHSCVQVYIEVTDINDNAPWPQRALYSASIPEQAAGGTLVATVTAEDLDDAGNVTYRIVAGNPDGLFSIDELTGTIVTTGRTLDREASPSHALEVQASDGELASSARVLITVADINDHAPAFTQRFYQLRVPVTPGLQLGLPQGDAAAEDELSTESDVESEDEDEGSGEKLTWDSFEEPAASDVYVGTVLALDADAGINGTVRYTGRARGGRALRVHATTGRLYAVTALKIGGVYDLTVRACDGGGRCGWARVAVRGSPPGSGAPPRLPPPPPLQVAELDAPGFLLALLQAEDDEGDTLYYDIVDGDPRSEFHMGREDGSLVLARRLLWERQALYTLNISVSDGLNTIYTPVNITVVNDLNEGGLTFSQEQYTIEVDEDTRVGAALAAVHAGPPGGGDRGLRVLYGILAARAPASMPLFRLQELSGVLELAQPLDRETSSRHELTIWARDSAPRASRAYARLIIIVKDIDEHPPEWGRRLAEARIPSTAPIGSSVITLQATDRDFGENARITYSLAGGDASGSFEVDPLLGEVRLARELPVGVKEYTLSVRAANPPPAARSATLPLHVIVVEPDNAPPVFTTPSITSEVYSDAAIGTSLAVAEARSSCSVQYSLRGAEGRFRVNPAAGQIATAQLLSRTKYPHAEKRAPATQVTHQFWVVATNMGGGTSEIPVTIHVLERNEYPPQFTQREYRGRVSEAAETGALVSEQGSPEPLVLTTEDGDSPANQQKAFEVLDPDAARVFSINPTTGAVVLRESLDYETQPRYEFTVKVLDMGTPRLTSDSVATVIIDVIDVNDCAPKFPESTYTTTILLPTAKDVLVIELLAIDADSTKQTIKYDIIEGDEAGAFRLEQSGKLLVDKPDVLNEEYKLRVRASDGEYSSTTRVRVTVRTPEPAGLAFQKTDYYVSVVENSTKPVTVEVLNVLGAALNEHVEFKILNPVEGFQMGITSGAVTAGSIPLDREERSSYILLISARSVGALGGPGERVAHTRLHVSVTDVNDNCPVFVEKPYVAAVRAGDPPGTHVIKVHAIDADDNDNGEVRYEMKRGHGELFHVDRRSGLVTLKQTLDSHRQAYDLVIAAFDGGIRACGSEAAVTVRVWAGGASPSWESPQITLQAKELYTGPLTPALRAVSPLQRQLIYTLLQPEDNANFELQFDTAHVRGNSPCIIVISSPLDYESARTHTLTVRATDGVTGAHADVGVTVEVTDVNDCAPEFTKDMYRASVSEAAAVGDLVIVVKATDNDTGLNGEIVYSITGDWNTSKPLFYMDSSGGVRVAAPLDRERSPAHHATVTAADRGNPSKLTSNHLFITVEDVNDNPPRMERSVLSAVVSAEAARGTAVTAVSAFDPDSNDSDKLRYAIASHDPHHTFSIDSKTGVISLANPRAWALFAGSSNSMSLNVSVSDGAHAVFARVKLSPAPANTKAPHFQHLLHEARAMENQPPPLLLTTVKAYDEDAGEYGSITYSIPSALLRETFGVDPRSGALSANVPLDREARAEWLVPITASDGGGLLRHTTVRVRVADVNDNAPVFPHKEYRASLRPSRAPLAPFLTLTALDADEGDNAMIKYSIFDEEETKGFFHVDEATGALSLAKNISRFVGRDVNLWIRATDGGGLTAEAPVTVSVLAPSVAAPATSPPPPDLFLPEDAAPGTVIVELPAGEATYRLAEGLWSPELFEMDARGRLTLTGVLDRETAPLHRIGIISTTGSISSMYEIRLHVLDVNDHPPALHQPYLVQLGETAPPRSAVLQAPPALHQPCLVQLGETARRVCTSPARPAPAPEI